MVKHGQVMHAFKSCEWRPKEKTQTVVESKYATTWDDYVTYEIMVSRCFQDEV